MKALLLVYSGTGNTRLMGRVISRALDGAGFEVEMVDFKSWSSADFESVDLIGLGHPVYFWKPPLPVIDWLRNELPSGEGRAAFVFCTCAGALSRGLQISCELVLEKGYRLLGAESFLGEEAYPRLRFPFYVPMRGKPDGVEFAKAKAFVERVVKSYKIWRGDPTSVRDSDYPTDDGFFKLLGDFHYTPERMRFWLGRKSVDTELCDGCGVCEKRCPTGSVRMDGDYPVFDESACIACGTCYNVCPKDAVKIRLGWSSRYRGPKARDF